MENNIININEKAKKDFLNYASAVIKSRAISSIEDNLKPVHRRILYVMNEAKLWSNKKTIKSASVIGDTMKIHPHGDSSIYDAMVRLAQPWKMRYPLIDMQGNIGNILGDGPAAARYTETRLSKIGELILESIEKNCVPFKPTYDDSGTEPIILPSKFPNILCNGNAGIAVGLSSSLVPHNLNEVVDGIVAYIKNKSISIEQLMRFIPAPDFPTGGMIMDSNKLLEIYKTGNGTITLRSKYRIEEQKGRQHIIIYEVPFLVNIEDGVVEPLKKLVIEEGFDLIDDYINETNQNGINLRIILKKGANIYKVLDTLWKKTRLQITQRINNTILIDSNPKVLNLKEMIELYVQHRHNIIINIAKYDLQKTEHKLNISLGIIKAFEKIDEIIELIKKSNNRASAKSSLIEFLQVNEEQANAILDLKISKLSKLDKIEIEDEIKSLQENKKQLETLIGDSRIRESQIFKELINIKNLHGDKRRTTLSAIGDFEGDRVDPIKLFLFDNGNIFVTQQELNTLNFSKKGTILNQSAIKSYIETDTNSFIRVFSKEGNMHIIKTLTLGIESIESLDLPESPLCALNLEEEKYEFLVFITKNGLVKKTPLKDYTEVKSNIKTIKLKEGDELISVIPANNNMYLYILGERLVKFPVSEIQHTTRLTIGSKGISGIAYAAVAANETDKILTINDMGQAKFTMASDFNITAKGSNGQIITENTRFISSVNALEIFVYADKKNSRLDLNKLSVKKKTAVGAKVITGTVESISN